MKMFLTRLGFGSKMVVTGDVTQVDLPGGTGSGLRVVQDILDGRPRHPLRQADQPRRGPAPLVGRSSTPTRATRRARPQPSRRAAAGHGPSTGRTRAADRREHRDQQRVGRRRRRGRARASSAAVRARPDGDHTRWPSCPSLLVDAEAPWPACTSSGWRSPARPTCSRSRWTSCGPQLDGGPTAPGPDARRLAEPGLLGDVVLCPRGGGGPGERSRPLHRRPSLSCCARTASCTCSATTTPTRKRKREMFGLQAALLGDVGRVHRPRAGQGAASGTGGEVRDTGVRHRPHQMSDRPPMSAAEVTELVIGVCLVRSAARWPAVDSALAHDLAGAGRGAGARRTHRGQAAAADRGRPRPLHQPAAAAAGDLRADGHRPRHAVRRGRVAAATGRCSWAPSP